MERDAINELFDYTGWAWERIARTIDEQLAEAYAKPMKGSGWPSIAACLSHSISAYDGWLNGEWGQIRAGELSYPAEWPKPVDDWPAMKAYHARVRESFRRVLDVPDDVLYQELTINDGFGPEQMSRADILANLVIHERGHHGDLNALFHLHGVKGYYIDYRFFRTLPERFVLDEEDN
ncbi:MAG: DinB family protein [Dehalococcoidia bacterium]|nr:DinB family protein [Dehalococcoidia bacterium]